MSLRIKVIFIFLCCTNFPIHTQELDNGLTKIEKDSIISNIGRFFEDNYVFPEKGRKIHKGLQAKNDKKEFDSITDPEVFRKVIQTSIRSIIDDKHIILIHRDPEENDNLTHKVSDLRLEFDHRKEINFGIPKLAVLDRNIGYMEITKFTSLELFEPVIRASSEYLKNVDALILDLRSRGGGRSETVLLLLSYFLNSNAHIFSWYDRDSNMFEENWTLPFVDGHRFTGIPIVVLTSERTFSGSEAFSYAMKHHKRATVIGEITRGGAHTYKEMYPSEKYLILVPYARVVSAKTKDNWEGKGVIPNIEISAEEALETAKIRLIEIMDRGK